MRTLVVTVSAIVAVIGVAFLWAVYTHYSIDDESRARRDKTIGRDQFAPEQRHRLTQQQTHLGARARRRLQQEASARRRWDW